MKWKWPKCECGGVAGKEPIRASGDCICSVCGKRYGDHPTDKVVLSAIDSLPFLHVLCDGTRVKL